MKTLVSEKGQVVIPKKIREVMHIEKGDELEIETVGETIILKPVRRFRAKKWQDYVGIGEGLVDAHLGEKKKEKANEDVYP
ncbi:MAG TPA: AbrB/MazE/SpoVT family DNA-binding domain-containing protein [Dissulfurispiraceae bacterium]|nr:AbrB/MazE/SpoVT family DNA-binding domain-containing protein [Dissulfurispiraceae bacterium]